MEFIGRSNNLLLFSEKERAVVVDSAFNLVVDNGDTDKLTRSKAWYDGDFADADEELASAALSSSITASASTIGRRYTVPKGAQNAAKKALQNGGGTPVGRSVAKTLVAGGQVDMATLRHINRHFSRHASDHADWALWGGDTAEKWSRTIIERENNTLIAAGIPVELEGESTPVDDFRDAYELDSEYGPEFLARVRMDGSGIDRLYKIDFDGRVYVWDDGQWDDMGYVDNDIYMYDSRMDDVYDTTEKSHILVDPDSAVIIGSRLHADPTSHVTVDDIDAEEARMAQESIDDTDWGLVDFATITAAAPAPTGDGTPGQYTPEERAQNAQKQVRDATGKFAKVGSRVMVGGDPAKTGNITRVDPSTGNVTVAMANGQPQVVPGSSVQGIGAFTGTIPGEPVEVPNVDFSGILAEPRTPVDRVGATLPGTLPAMTPQDLHSMLMDFPAWVQSQRAGFNPQGAGPAPVNVQAKNSLSRGKAGDAYLKKNHMPLTNNAYNHPLLKNWIRKTNPKNGIANSAWYNPITAAVDPTSAEHEMTPDNSDVQPIYMAVVAPEDPRAVLNLISLIPASSKSLQPMTYKRKDGEWVADPQSLNDLKSATPPPVVPLDSDTLNDVLKQVDQSEGADENNKNPEAKSDSSGVQPNDGVAPAAAPAPTPPVAATTPVTASGRITTDEALIILYGPHKAIIAAGGANRNRGGAEQLRHYWVHGKGALKIRWGTPGDWKRCVRHLAKYIADPKGYCQLRHKEATGIYTATHAKNSRGRSHAVSEVAFTFDDGWTPEPEIVELMQDEANFSGGADRNRGGAEKLRRYWVHGAGAAKIRWGTPGDWKRCVRHLSKYMTRAEGYCELRHKEATGITPPEHAKREHSTIEFATVTEVTEQDMALPLEEILAESDPEFDATWEPDQEIVDALGDETAITAAGGLDRNRGQAEKLRRYWTIGQGGAKIRWNSGGDWTRCVRHLEKYLGPRAKGYCALRHKEMTGQWTGDKRHMQLYGREHHAARFSNEFVPTTDAFMEKVLLSAKADDARSKFRALTADGGVGSRFSMPLVMPEGVESGDGRIIKEGAITMRDFPLPLLWQMKSGDGHSGSVIVGRIDHMERIDEGIGNAHGVFDSGAYGREAERLVREGFLRGISADMDQFEAKAIEEPEPGDSEAAEADDSIKQEKMLVNKARIMAVTLVPKPAFQECRILLADDEEDSPQIMPINVTVDDDEDPFGPVALAASGFLKNEIPVAPPKEWFTDPKFPRATPIHVDETGRVYGHIALWKQDHIGLSFGTKPPRSRSGYAYFHTGVVRTEEGADVPVGQLTLAGGHASMEASASEAIRHYDDTASAIADVHAGEDSYGIWVAGSLRPEATASQIRALRASAPSGDWRPINNKLELVAVCQVNVPGFPVARAMVASGSQEVYALVAAGAQPLAEMQALEIRARQFAAAEQTMKNLELAERAFAARQRVHGTKPDEVDLKAKAAEISKQFSDMADFKVIPPKKRKELAKKGQALDDGSFPIENEGDLKRAIRAYGRAKEGDRAKVRRHIIKRARALGKFDLIPDDWKKSFSSEDIESRIERMQAVVAAARAQSGEEIARRIEATDPKALTPAVREQIKALGSDPNAASPEPQGTPRPGQPGEPGVKTNGVGGFDTPDSFDKYTPKTQPRDEQGQFRQILARLRDNLGVSGNQAVVEQIKSVENLDNAGNYTAASSASNDLINTIDRMDSGALNATSITNVRTAATDLAKTIANLPLPFANQAQKVRFSDLPPALRELTQNMIDRVEAKIGHDDAAKATSELKHFMSGADVYSQSEINSQLNRMLRLLT